MENWKTIENFENYEVSDLGHVRNKRTGRVLKPNIVGKGYCKVDLHKDKKRYAFYIHRLVAKAFIDNPNNLPQVNHIDEDKTNNAVFNLEWCSCEYNINYGDRTEKCCKPVLQYSLDDEFIKEWSSISEAEDTLHIDNSSIVKCCKGKLKSAGKFIWRYK